jgi:hypothetical protein
VQPLKRKIIMPKLPKTKTSIIQRLHDKYRPKSTKAKPVMPKDKGEYLGSCNRSACLRSGAHWYNHGSLAYYCANCAMDLNYDTFNKRDALENWGHLLCTEGKYDREKFEKIHDLHHNSKLYLDITIPKGTLGTYLPDNNENWQRTREFIVREDTRKNQSVISVKFHDGECRMIPMTKVQLSNRKIHIN